jgi:acetolactate synthase-1/2/3 large subunit
MAMANATRRNVLKTASLPALTTSGLTGPWVRVTDPARQRSALEQALANAPALIDVVVTRDTVSTDAAKGPGFLHDYQALTPWNEAEEARRS